MRLILLAVVVLSGCTDLFGPDLTMWGRRPLDPPPAYATWYTAVEACLGQAGDFGAVEWFVADSIARDGDAPAGLLVFPNSITVVTAYADEAWAVKHEMIHHVLRRGDEIHGRYAHCQATH